MNFEKNGNKVRQTRVVKVTRWTELKQMNQLLITPLIAALLIGCGNKEETAKPAPPNVDVFKAAGEGNLEALKQHIAAGTDLNQRSTDGQKTTPLMAAAGLGQAEAAKMLIEAKADLNLQNKDGNTALHTAAFLCHPEIVKALLKAGADKAIKSNTGATALDGALAPWDQVKPIYDLLNGILFKPAGIPLDYNRIQQTRPKIAEMLS